MSAPRALLIVAWLMGSLSMCVGAAPVARDDDRSDDAASSSAAEVAPSSEATPPVSGHRTIDLLLQMQPDWRASSPAVGDLPQSAGLPRPAMKSPPPADPTPLDQLKETMLTSGVRQVLANQAPDPARDARMAQERQRRETEFGSPQEPRIGGAMAGAGAGGSLLDVAVIRYIRENRWMVIFGSLVVLALAYGAANFSYHRRRR